MTDNMLDSYQWLTICLNHTNDWYYAWIQTYYQSLVWFRHIISYWYDSNIIWVNGMIQVYYQSTMFESYQWLIVCLNHANDWYYVWITPMTDNIPEWFRHTISHWYDSDILSVIRMIKTYHQSLVWFKHTISHWYDSSILSVICMIQMNHTNDW
jgi:hypothetical protein